ncbi:aspartic protease [Aphelenchoides avenae]|nr:aspartic protease [Aphelenchus avenae]
MHSKNFFLIPLLAAVFCTCEAILRVYEQPLVAYRDTFYAAQFKVGTPGQAVFLAVVVGQLPLEDAQTQVAASSCDGCCAANGFNETKSATFKLDARFGASGKRLSDFGTDTINIVPTSGIEPSAGKQRLEVVTFDDQTSLFGKQPFDGVMDFSMNSNVLVESLDKNGLLEANMFIIYLKRTCSSGVNESAGVITYGAIDTARCANVQNYVKIEQTEKPFRLATVTIDSVTLRGVSSTYAWKARLSISTVMTMPTKVFEQLNTVWQASVRTIDGIERWFVDCNRTFDPLVLSIGGQKYFVPDYAYVRRNGDECVLVIVAFGGEKNAQDGFLQLGLPFAYEHCLVFDVANKQFAFPAHASPQTTACKYEAAGENPKKTRCKALATTTPSAAEMTRFNVSLLLTTVLAFAWYKM